MTWHCTTLQVPFNHAGVPAFWHRFDFGSVQADQRTRWISEFLQPWCEWVALLPGCLGLKQNEMAFGPRHRDVGEAFRFGATLQLIAMTCSIPQPPMRIESHTPAAGVVPWGYAPQRTFPCRGCFPQIRTDHHRLLQSLAAMNSHNSNRTLGQITEGLALFWDRVRRIKALASQPIGTT